MIGRIVGKLWGMNRDGSIVVGAGGVGYEVNVDDRLRSVLNVRGLGSDVDIMTRAIYREDAATLYGFAAVEDRNLFDEVIKLKGVGPSVALALLCFDRAIDIRQRFADKTMPSTIPRVGKVTMAKLAEALS
jgi:holliday junction DNA helicase RuvA